MKNGKQIAIGLLSIGTAILLVGASQGTETDPLVTKSYIDDVVSPSIMASLESRLSQQKTTLTEEFDTIVAQYKAELEENSSDSGQGDDTTTEPSSVFEVVTLSSGQSLICTTGSELLLRSGTATVVAASLPGLVDSTWGTTLASESELLQNHLYLITADGRGLLATSEVTVMVRGSYTIS